MKKHGVMLFTFVVLFLTLGCDLAYGQGEEGNEKEEVTVTLNFSQKGAFGLKKIAIIIKVNQPMLLLKFKIYPSHYVE